MGWQMESHERELCYPEACQLVSGWVSSFDKSSSGSFEDIGYISYPDSAVQLANRSIPLDYDSNVFSDADFIKMAEEEKKKIFEDARDFLFYAAEHRHGIRGSY